MRLIKYTHACVLLEDGDRKVLIDPGIWAEDEAFAAASAVLITHEHYDHIDAERIAAAVGKNTDLKVYAPAPVVAELAKLGDAAVSVESGQTFTAGGFSVAAVGGRHAQTWGGKPDCANLGYVVEGIYHPGD